jgi:hypothetical protein
MIGLVPFKNSTLVTLPSESEAVAVRVKDAGALKISPLVRLVIETIGGKFADKTTIVPSMFVGCTVQWNVNRPAEVNLLVKENRELAEAACCPESHKPVSLVVEWEILKVFVQVHTT